MPLWPGWSSSRSVKSSCKVVPASQASQTLSSVPVSFRPGTITCWPIPGASGPRAQSTEEAVPGVAVNGSPLKAKSEPSRACWTHSRFGAVFRYSVTSAGMACGTVPSMGSACGPPLRYGRSVTSLSVGAAGSA